MDRLLLLKNLQGASSIMCVKLVTSTAIKPKTSDKVL